MKVKNSTVLTIWVIVFVVIHYTMSMVGKTFDPMKWSQDIAGIYAFLVITITVVAVVLAGQKWIK